MLKPNDPIYVVIMGNTPMRAYSTRALAQAGRDAAEREWQSANPAASSVPVPYFWTMPVILEA